MILTEEQRKKLLAFINEKWWKPPLCAQCRQNNWNIPTHVFELREFLGGSVQLGGNSPLVPVCPISCNNCGYTVLVNAIVAGLELPKSGPGPDATAKPQPEPPQVPDGGGAKGSK